MRQNTEADSLSAQRKPAEPSVLEQGTEVEHPAQASQAPPGDDKGAVFLAEPGRDRAERQRGA